MIYHINDDWALSADHLEYASDTSLQLMARSGVVAGLLPGAFYFLRETRLPPIEKRIGVTGSAIDSTWLGAWHPRVFTH